MSFPTDELLTLHERLKETANAANASARSAKNLHTAAEHHSYACNAALARFEEECLEQGITLTDPLYAVPNITLTPVKD